MGCELSGAIRRRYYGAQKTLAADWRQRQIKITAAASSRWTSDRYAGRLKDGRTDR